MLEKPYKANAILRRMRDNYKGPPVLTAQAENIGAVFERILSFTNFFPFLLFKPVILGICSIGTIVFRELGRGVTSLKSTNGCHFSIETKMK
jgi:hypothetical protein